MKFNLVLASSYNAGAKYCMEKGFAPADVYLILPHEDYTYLFNKIRAVTKVDERDFSIHYAFGADCIPDHILVKLSELFNIWMPIKKMARGGPSGRPYF